MVVFLRAAGLCNKREKDRKPCRYFQSFTWPLCRCTVLSLLFCFYFFCFVSLCPRSPAWAGNWKRDGHSGFSRSVICSFYEVLLHITPVPFTTPTPPRRSGSLCFLAHTHTHTIKQTHTPTHMHSPPRWFCFPLLQI